MNKIFAKKVTIIQKNGHRIDYTHVVEFEASVTYGGKVSLLIVGEIDDVDGTRCNSEDKYAVKDLEMTIIDWYIPKE